MSIVLNGNLANVTTPLTATVTGLANNGSGLVRVATSAPHLFGPTDTVSLRTTSTSGTFTIAVIDGTHFDLVGSTYTATGTGLAIDLSLTPQVLVPTDGDTFSQQLSGALSSIQAILDRDQYVNNQVRSLTLATDGVRAQTWSPEFTQNNSVAVMSCRWAPKAHKWLLVQQGSLAIPLVASYGLDGGASAGWVTIGTPPTIATAPSYGACIEDPTTAGQYWVAVTDTTATHNTLGILHYNGSAWSAPYGPHTGVGLYYSVELSSIGAQLIFAASSSGAGDSVIMSTNNQFATLSTFTVPNVGATGSVFYIKSNGKQVVAIQSQNSAGSFPVFTSPDGVTWSTSTSLSTLVGAGYGQLMGLTWTQDALGSCWLACINPFSSGIPTFFRSADGITWTAQLGGMTATTIDGVAAKVQDMASCGNNVVCTLLDAGSGPAISSQIFSVDGGITWYVGQAGFPSNTSGSSSNNRSRVASADGTIGFVATNGLWTRFSALCGLPAASV
jgi:hypothetical protein